MGLLNLISLLLLAVAAAQFAVLWRRVRDWRSIFPCLTLLMASLPGLIEFLLLDGSRLRMSFGLHDVQHFSIGVLAVLAALYMQRLLITEKQALHALAQSEEKLRSLIENVPDAILRIDRTGKVLFLNRRGLGFSIDDIVDSSAYRYLPPEVRETGRQSVEKAFDTAQTVELDVPTVGKGGQRITWYTCRIVPDVQDGQVLTATVIATDITKRKRDEDERRRAHDELEQRVAERTSELARANDELCLEIMERKQAEAQLSRRIEFERIVSGISSRFIDLDSDQIDAAVTDTLRTISQFARTEHSCICRLQGDPVRLSMVHEWYADGIQPSYEMMQNLPMDQYPWFWGKIRNLETVKISSPDQLSNEAIAFRSLLESRNIQSLIAMPLKTSHSVWGYLSLAVESHPVIWTDDTVALLKIVGEICLSALERKQANEALRDSQSRLHRLFQGNIIGSVYSNIHGRLYDANDSFLNMTGYTREDLPLNWEKLTPPEWKPMDQEARDRLIVDGFTLPREKEYLHKDGHRVPILIGIALLTPDSEDCVGFVLDLTERKMAEQRVRDFTVKLENASRLSVMGEMTAGLAHELHQPLAVIANYANGCARWLEKETIDRKRLIESLGEVTAQALRAAEILRRIRNFLHQRETEWQIVNLNTVIHNAIHLAKLNTRHKDVKMTSHLEKDLPDSFADEIQLTQTVLNLLLNGIEAMDDHPDAPRTLAIESNLHGPRHVQVTIADSGSGVLPELREKIFDQFYTTKPDGLGMGLAICKSTIEAHGGQLWMTPRPQGGTEFSFTIPIERNGETAHRSPEPARSIPSIPK